MTLGEILEDTPGALAAYLAGETLHVLVNEHEDAVYDSLMRLPATVNLMIHAMQGRPATIPPLTLELWTR